MRRLDLQRYTQWLTEIQEQPPWRAKADRESDYYDGNQLDAQVLREQNSLGIPPAIEPLIGPTIDAVLGMEVKARLDWRVKAETGADEIALALNEELNQAERNSGADAACSEAYAGQIKVGLHWVEVARNHDPFKYRYRCRAIHRNEIWWDWLARAQDLSDARYLIRRKWMSLDQAELFFPDQRDLIRQAGGGWQGIELGSFATDGGTSTDLAMAYNQERGWSIEEMEWRDLHNHRVCLFEVWYQVWETVTVIKTPDGRVVEYDKANPAHVAAVASGAVKPARAVVSRMRLAWWLGPHCLWDGPSPYRHNRFPYVPFWGKREDRTGAPYGLIRGMMYLQDEVNARISKMQWGLSAIRSIRTKGAVLMSDEEFNNEIARPDADIILDPQKMRQDAGGVFKVERDFSLNQQQYQRLVDCREGIKRTGGIYNAFMGQGGEGKSGVALNTLVEQSSQALADINDNFKSARSDVGDLLLSLIIEDLGRQEHEVNIPAGVSREARTIRLNVPATDESGIQYFDNDIQRVKLKVELADVPSTPTFRSQQLQTLGSAFETMPPKYQAIALPFLLALMDIPHRDEILEAVKNADQQPTTEQIEQMVEERVNAALLKAQTAIREREVAVKERLAAKDELRRGVEAAQAAMETGAIIAANPAVADLGDAVMEVAAGVNAPRPMQGNLGGQA